MGESYTWICSVLKPQEMEYKLAIHGTFKETEEESPMNQQDAPKNAEKQFWKIKQTLLQI